MADQHAGPSSVTTPKKKRKVRGELAKDEAKPSRKQRFLEAWLELPEFKGWLAPDPRNPFRASCKACNASLVAGHTSKAALKLPRNVEDLLRNVANYFSHSCKRQAQLAELQEYLHKEKNKILRPSETRWLVLHQCVERVLQEWETLKLLFLQAATEDRIVAAELILKDMNPITEAYLKFMQCVLGFFNKLNAMFQSKDSLIAVIQEESQRLLRCLCQNFMKPSSIEDPAKLNPLDPRSLLALEELYVGAGCQGILDKITMERGSSEVRDFKLRCMSFYQTAELEPSTALSNEARKRLPSLPVLQDRYKHLLPSVGDVEQEWRMLPSFFTESEKIELQTKSPDAFWGQVSKTKTFDHKLVLPNIATLAKLVLTLPHSNAETERIFSMLSDMKTRTRNRLGPESVNALLLVKSAMATRRDVCQLDCERRTYEAL
ncbi:hypothetical protein HPB47_026426 [Ixodes persulcatus]|uniref:Uncharacterized protein n=1 Tax=Ixodes persulcatus TaxID=34615 RepID=A0AC60PZ29_IXOPE|nr:hypothetical protein HPB47_026426 [Ixodes persulcatus]